MDLESCKLSGGLKKVTWPRHHGMIIEHNPHKMNYQTVAEWSANGSDGGSAQWISDEQRKIAVETDSIWTMQWYPNTPISFRFIAAATFEELIEYASHAERGPEDVDDVKGSCTP